MSRAADFRQSGGGIGLHEDLGGLSKNRRRKVCKDG